MKRSTYLFVSLGALVLLASALMAPAQQKPGDQKRKLITQYDLPGLEKRISMDLREPMSIEDFIKFLAIKGELNVVIGKDVVGSTKLMLQDVTVGDALEIVLAANNLAYEVKGNIIKVMTDPEYEAIHGEKFYERRQAKIVELKYATPSRVAAMLAEVKSTIGKIVFDDTTGTIVLIDTPEKIKAMDAVIEKEDLATVSRVVPTVTKVFKLEHAEVDAIQTALTSALTKDIGTLKGDKRTKTVIVTDLAHNMVKIEQIIAAFDRRPRQVFIEAKVVQVDLSDQYQLGINWTHVFDGVDPRFSLKTVSQFPALPSGSRLASLSYATVGGAGNLGAVIDALKTVGDTKILSNPHISVLDGEEATIKVIKNQPYVLLQYESGTTNVVGQTYNFVEVGVSLAVTPRISTDNGMITMNIKPEISDITDWYRGAPQEGTPVVEKSVAETSVMVKDGETIIIAGLIRNNKIKSVNTVPVLGRIPLLGMLFKYTTDSTENNETVIFLTPQIITGEEPFSRTKSIERKIRAARSSGAGS